MIIYIDNQPFKKNIGLKVLKSKYEEKPLYVSDEEWKNTQKVTIEDIFQIENTNSKAVAFTYLSVEEIISCTKAKLVNSKTLNKKTEWIVDGVKTTKEFKDTYELYKVKKNNFTFLPYSYSNHYFVKFKDTSTERDYIIWVPPYVVSKTNFDPIEAIAWTIQTDIDRSDIVNIIRQGDSVLIQCKEDAKPLKYTRHLEKEEYLKFLTLES